MTELTSNQKGMVAATAALLVLAGGTVFLTPEQIDNAYVCPLTEEVWVFDSLSSSGKTGYYFVNGTKESKACRIGSTYQPWEWISLTQYLEKQNESIVEKDSGGNKIVTVIGRAGIVACKYHSHLGAYTKCFDENDSYVGYAGEIIIP